MNRLASRTQTDSKVPRIVATLKLDDVAQRELHGFFQRMHTGRWPMLRTLAMKQKKDGTILEAAEWLQVKRGRYAVLKWSARDGVVAWRCLEKKTRAAAIAAIRSL